MIYIRYKIVSGAGKSSSVKSYTAKIGTYSQDASCGSILKTESHMDMNKCINTYHGQCKEGTNNPNDCTCNWYVYDTCWH